MAFVVPIESKSPEANLSVRDNIVQMEDTFIADIPAAARAGHTAKMDAETTARVSRGALAYHGNVTGGSIKRGKG